MRILRVIFAIAVLCAPFYAQQVNTDIVPASPGLYLGHTNQRWNGYFNNADIYNLTINGSPIGTAGVGLPQISIPNGTNCTILNSLVEFDGNGQAQTASLSSTKVIGVAVSGAGCSGNVLVQYAAIVNCTTDGSTLINDRIAASNSIAGDCMDIGPISIPGIQTVGLVTAVSSGAGQLTSFDLFTGDTISPSSSSGSGVVSVSPCIGPFGYAATAAAIVSWDCNTSLDGSGNAGFKKVTVTGSGAGKIDFGTSTTPGNPSAGFFRLYADSGTGFLTCLTSTGASCLGSNPAFSSITSGTNTAAAMLLGTGSSLFTTGAGQNRASSAGFPTAAQTGPGTVSETNCSSIGNAFQWTQLADGTYAQQAAIDTSTTMPNVSGPLGTLVHCRREWWNDANSVPQFFKNAMVAFFHKNSFGVDTTSNDNRTVAVGLLLDNSYAAASTSSAQAWYTEVDMTGAPQLGRAVITPLDESVDVLAGVVGDTRSGKTGASNGPSVGVRGANFYNGTFNQPWQSCTFCNFGVVGNAGNASSQGLAAQGYFGVGVFGYCRGDLGAGTEGCYGVYGQVADVSQTDTTAAVAAFSGAGGNDFFATRYTDTSPTGLFLRLKALGSNTTIYSVDKSGNSTGTKFSTAAGPVSGNWNCINVTPVTVNTNTAADQNMMACTIPAATLNSVSKTLRIYAAGIYSTPSLSTSQMTMKVKLCTVSGCGSGTVITPISIQSTALGTVQITNDNFSLHSNVTTQTTGASSAYEAHGEFLIDLATLTTAADSSFGDTNTATVGTIDATGQLFLQMTFAFSNASASNSATQRQLIVDTVN